MTHPRRLIEVDLPIKEISAHARREKSIRHGHISTLHIWWARRPLAACRAVVCAALWPDPVDPNCPQAFRDRAAEILCEFAETVRHNTKLAGLVGGHFTEWNRTKPVTLKGHYEPHWPEIRYRLLDFIADFANWDASTVPAFLETSRALTQAAHEALGGEAGTRPLVVDPFAGGGAIPLEALRVGADAFASDLNPVAVLLNKVVLEYIPKYGNAEIRMKDADGKDRTFDGLAEAVRYWGGWIKEQAEKELGEFYPKDPDGATPIAYLWARTIRCEGPGCGAEVPLIRSLWLAKKKNRSRALKLIPRPRAKRVDFEIIENPAPSDIGEGTIKNGAATCPCCGFTSSNETVRESLAKRNGGASTAKLFAVVLENPGEYGRGYRTPNDTDGLAADRATKALQNLPASEGAGGVVLPTEAIPPERPSPNARGLSPVTRMGCALFTDLFHPRQLISISTIQRLICNCARDQREANPSVDLDVLLAIELCLAFALDKSIDFWSSFARWIPIGEKIGDTFARQALSVVWDFAEGVPTLDFSGGWERSIRAIAELIDRETNSAGNSTGTISCADAGQHPLPDDSVSAVVTDPPYYDSVPYLDLSSFFSIWLSRTLSGELTKMLSDRGRVLDEEAIWNPTRIHTKTGKPKDHSFYESKMLDCFRESRRIAKPDGIGTVVFAHKSTSGWEAILQALIDAGWTVTGSWPIDTERGGRTNAQGTAALASSVHIACRPRENSDGSVREEIGDWRDVLAKLPGRIREWMPRLAHEGVVGADAIFACLGPALEIFSRYSSVERASGEPVTLREYLVEVWGAVGREALTQVFAGADTAGFEADARLTAMWLWTLSTANGDGGEDGKVAQSTGYTLEYDAARKIAQGLGVHMEALSSLVEVKGDKARLLPVRERSKALFGREAGPSAKAKKDPAQIALFETPEDEKERAVAEGLAVESVGETTLDRVHQSMLLFAAGRGEALRRFLVEDGAGNDPKFWSLAQALSALYPTGTDEKRWVDGVLARKKGLGL